MVNLQGEENARLFAMRKRAENTVKLIKQMDDVFPSITEENAILAIMASNFDSFWEGWNYNPKNREL
jgi:hypothetical protein